MLNERSQTQKAMFYMIPFIQNEKNRQIHMESHLMVAKGLELGRIENYC